MRKFFAAILPFLYACNTISQPKIHATKMDTLVTWERKNFTTPGDKPFIFYVVYGNFTADFRIKPAYRTAGIPAGFIASKYGPSKHPETVKSFLQGYLWEQLQKENTAVAGQFSLSKECIIIRGEASDTSNLNYLRDIVGFATYLLDNGGVGIYDPQGFRFLSKTEWLGDIFEPDGPVPRNHVIILTSEDKSGTWYHTRGLRKFGRPDLSIHNVPPQYEDAVYDLFNRFIEYQGFGGIIDNGQEVKLKTLPAGMWCETKGDFDDPDFNNKHVEIYWR